MNWPNIITSARIVLVPVFVIVYLLPGQQTYLWAAALFSLASLTDWVDGYLARRLGQSTRFGAFLDPVADKIIVVTALILIVGRYADPWLTVPALIIVGREIVITALREWMAEVNRRGIIAVNWTAKIKTTFQMAAVIVLLATPPEPESQWMLLGYGLLYLAVAMTLWSMIVYLRAAWPTFLAGMTSDEADDLALKREDS